MMWQNFKRAGQYRDGPTEYRILRLVRDSKTISRTEIAQRCRLSKPTVSDIVNRFLKGGFLEKVGESASTDRGGRKRELLRFNPEAGYVIGVDVRMTESVVAITDLNANILQRTSYAYPAGSSPSSVLKGIYRSIDSLLSSQRMYLTKAVGIGVGLPGVIDRASGTVRTADTLVGWEGVHLRTHFKRRYNLPVYVDNDVKARTLGEYLFGAGKNRHNQIFLWIGDGIGAGIIIDGKLHRGVTESAGEIGYNELCNEISGKRMFPVLYDGQRDFGQILSNQVILRRYAVHAPKISALTFESLFRVAAHGDKVAHQVIEEVASLLSTICINFINTLNPELIVVGGKITECSSPIISLLQTKVREDILSVPVEAVKIVASKLQDDGVILGAVGLALYDLFRPAIVQPFVPEHGVDIMSHQEQ